jgi:1-deoxyxylulose-5-phosphate synthase
VRSSTPRAERPEDFAVLEDLRDVAAKRGTRPSVLALAWLLAQEGVIAPLVGATSEAHIDDAAEALGVQLTDEDVRALQARYLPRLGTDYS